MVHHKVAAKVEHAGFLGATNNVLDMNFGDLDPANGAMMVPSQGSLQMRGRSSSQGSVGSNGSRMGPPPSVSSKPDECDGSTKATELLVKSCHNGTDSEEADSRSNNFFNMHVH